MLKEWNQTWLIVRTHVAWSVLFTFEATSAVGIYLLVSGVITKRKNKVGYNKNDVWHYRKE